MKQGELCATVACINCNSRLACIGGPIRMSVVIKTLTKFLGEHKEHSVLVEEWEKA